ncbi:MAG TPA: rhodanese-like domain-containing protein, partial [Deinococcales bacterium]|nr:rhodanese-like domain-containing protein [Deinococcales bacterium]
PRPVPRSLGVRLRPELVVTAEDVAARPAGTLLLDSRAPERYRGEVEPIDAVAGHIPGASNGNWADGLAPDGRYRPPAEQRERLKALLEAREAVVYCGSGVSAAANLLALEIAGGRPPGLPPARLYAGSWSDWISDPARPVAWGDEQAGRD